MENLESLAAEQREMVRRLQEQFDRLTGRGDESRPRHTVHMDSTGAICEPSFARMLQSLPSHGDLDFCVILWAMRKEAMGLGAIKSWRPAKPEVKLKKNQIVQWMLSTRNVHKFSSDQVIFTEEKCSIWTDLVEEVFLEECKDPKEKVYLVNYFRAAARTPTFFGAFTKTLVRTHREHCRSRSCGSPPYCGRRHTV